MSKRAVDVLISLLMLVVSAPLLLLVAVAVFSETGRPIVFKQRRVGRGGHEFGMYKFRSMVRDAARAGPYFTRENDPRITRVGRVIRRTSLDELPQLFNVLSGDMSLVGPRPDLPAQRGLYTAEEWAQRCSVRPGITGLSQALLRSQATQEQRTALDLRYVREHDLCMDVKIMCWTLGRLSGRGSN